MSQCVGCDTNSGPGYASPEAAIRGPRETLIYVTVVQPNGLAEQKPDYVAVIDVNPVSDNYCQVLSRCLMPTCGDELHHSGWNSCSSCYSDPTLKRDKLILPCLRSNRVYIVDIGDGINLKVEKVVDNLSDVDVSAPHTSHCLPSSEIMISCMGDNETNGKGDFLILDAKTFEVKKTLSNPQVKFGYDFWYQPRHNILVSSEWGSHSAWLCGFDPTDVTNGKYGNNLNLYRWDTKEFLQHLDLGADGLLPLEVRFLHDPSKVVGFVGCALSSSVFMFTKDENNKWFAKKVIQVESLSVNGWALPQMPGIITDIIISMDDKYLYFSNWIQGDIRQYDITNPDSPKLVGQIFLGGCLCKDGVIRVIDDKQNLKLVDRPTVKDVPLRGGPQMLQLSLDGRRLYVTNSLYSHWDKQFYPDMFTNGSHMLLVDVDIANGGMTLNEDFLVDFSKEPNGPVLAHEMRYNGGDCTSDIFL